MVRLSEVIPLRVTPKLRARLDAEAECLGLCPLDMARHILAKGLAAVELSDRRELEGRNMQNSERGRRDDAGEQPPATGGMCTGESGASPTPTFPIMTGASRFVKSSGRVLLVLEPGKLPTVHIEAASDREQDALTGLVAMARRPAKLAGSVTR